MKFLNCFFTTLAMATMGQSLSINPYDAFIRTLEPVLNEDVDVNPFNLLYGAAKANANDTIAKYEGLYNNATDECIRGCYSYSIHLLEITYNLNCDNKFAAINAEYKNNKPCYRAGPDMQKVLDNGNAYLDLFCAKSEKNEPCPYVRHIADLPKNTTIIEKSCKIAENERTQCDTTLIQSLSIMSDSNSKLVNKTATYASGGKMISFNAPNFNLTNIEDVMRNNTCLANIEPPKQILKNTADGSGDDANTLPGIEGESGAITQTMSLLMIVLSVVFTTLFF